MRTGRPEGTTKPLRQDPVRHAVALAAMLRETGIAEQVAYRFVIALFDWKQVKLQAVQLKGVPARLIEMTFERPRLATGLESRVSTLKRKEKRAHGNDDDAFWLSQMKAAWSIVIFMEEIGREQQARLAYQLCEIIGERDFAEGMLLPILMRAGQGPLNFPAV